MVIKNGESVNLSPKSVHTFSNNSDNMCRWVNIHSPKGFLKFFEELGVPDNEDEARQRSVDPAIIQRVMDTAANYDMMIQLPQ